MRQTNPIQSYKKLPSTDPGTWKPFFFNHPPHFVNLKLNWINSNLRTKNAWGNWKIVLEIEICDSMSNVKRSKY